MHAFFLFSGPNLALNQDILVPSIHTMLAVKTIGHVGSAIYVVHDVLFIYQSLLTLHIYTIYIYNMNIRYIHYILHIRYIIHI